MAEAALIVTAITAVAGAAYQQKAAKEANKAQKEQGQIERRMAEIENARQARRAIAARRTQQAEIQAQSANTGTGLESSSAVRGAVGSLTTQTAANIGAASTRAAGSWAYQRAGERGAQRSMKASNIASTFGAVSDIAGAYATFGATKPAKSNEPTNNVWNTPGAWS